MLIWFGKLFLAGVLCHTASTQELSCIISRNMTLIVWVFIITSFLSFRFFLAVNLVVLIEKLSQNEMINCFFADIASGAHCRWIRSQRTLKSLDGRTRSPGQSCRFNLMKFQSRPRLMLPASDISLSSFKKPVEASDAVFCIIKNKLAQRCYFLFQIKLWSLEGKCSLINSQRTTLIDCNCSN